MTDPLLAQSASTGSYPPATNSSSKASPTAADNAPPRNRRRHLTDPARRNNDHQHATHVVPTSWQTRGPITLASDTVGMRQGGPMYRAGPIGVS
jgi:hypothetical protein